MGKAKFRRPKQNMLHRIMEWIGSRQPLWLAVSVVCFGFAAGAAWFGHVICQLVLIFLLVQAGMWCARKKRDPKRLTLGWVVFEEIGECLINDKSISQIEVR